MNNNKGSALTFTIIAGLIVTILLVGMISLGGSYYRESLNNYTKRQAYLNAKSVSECISAYIVNNQDTLKNDDYFNEVLAPMKLTHDITINPTDIHLNDSNYSLGKIKKCIIKRDKDTLTMSIHSQVYFRGQTDSYNVYLAYNNEKHWHVGKDAAIIKEG
jgi:hypothetical protein